MSPEVIAWLQGLVNSVTLNVGAEDFEEVAALVTKAKRELAQAVDALPDEDEPPAA